MWRGSESTKIVQVSKLDFYSLDDYRMDIEESLSLIPISDV